MEEEQEQKEGIDGGRARKVVYNVGYFFFIILMNDASDAWRDNTAF